MSAEDELEFKIKLPANIGRRIRAKSEKEGRPLNRVIADELGEYPVLKAIETLTEQVAALAENNRETKVTLARYGARIDWLDLTDELLNAMELVQEALEADSQRDLQAAMDALRAGLLTARALGPEVKRKLKKP